jgi:nitrate reductase NapAB chaperone NapD
MIHILSFIVLTTPASAEAVVNAITARAFFMLPMSDLSLGKIILVAECNDLPSIEHEVTQVRNLVGVQAVTLVYHQVATAEELSETLA